uniref:uncharacterized protein LOC105352880 n=1 Tax=Fragaria vesca subsp. vesca TaxID=101020 RepID=UPI0005CB7CC6|nr:PREDICTED: uncharacterized protein LOC105352880 [Fragaria vesca subsp. vesca]
MTSGGSRRDPAWEHGERIPGNKNGSICKYCRITMKSGGVTRLKYHLSGMDPGNNVQRCEAVPIEVKNFIRSLLMSKQKEKTKKTHVMEEVRAELRGELIDSQDNSDDEVYPDEEMGPEELRHYRQAIRDSKEAQWNREHLHKIPNRDGSSSGTHMRRATSVRESQPTQPLAANLKSSFQARQKNIKDSFSKGSIKEMMGRFISKFFIYDNVPAAKVASPHFENMVIGIHRAGQGVLPPTPYEIRNKYLEMEFKDISEYVDTLKATWETYGCTIMCDGWTGPTRLSIINFMVYSKGTTVFLRSVDSSSEKKEHEYIYKLLKGVIKEVGERNMVQVVTDNAANYVKAGKKLMKNHNVYWTSCAAHCIDLMFEEMGKKEQISKVIDKGKIISKYVYNHNLLLTKMREFCKGEIIRAAPTRFATNFISLESLMKKKAGLKHLFTSEWWEGSSFSRTEHGRVVENIVLDQQFWTQVEQVCQISEPLYKVLRIVDTEVYPTMGVVYELMRVVKQELE